MPPVQTPVGAIRRRVKDLFLSPGYHPTGAVGVTAGRVGYECLKKPVQIWPKIDDFINKC